MVIEVRLYSPVDDYEMIADWWAAHNAPVIPSHLVPPVGFIAGFDGTDQVAVFLFFAKHVPVCFLGHIVSAPGMTAAQVADAGEMAIEFAKDFARGYGTEIMHVYAPKAIARFARRGGFAVHETEMVNIACLLQEEPCRQFPQ